MASGRVGHGRPPPDQVVPGHAGADTLPARILPAPVEATEWSLDRTRAALSELGDPHLKRPVLHIAGTNGKGSVAAMCASVLTTTGLKVGLYTSPHLCAFRERFRLGLEPVGEDVLVDAAARAYDAISRAELTFFEAATVLAFHVFEEQDVEVSVIEVGLGGRLDATNVVEPLVTAITNIGLDHTAYLGTSLTAIAREKAGIAKPGVPLVCGEARPPLVDLIRSEAARVGATFCPAPVAIVDPVGRSTHTVASDSLGTVTLSLPLAGAHQLRNAALAVGILERLPPHLAPPVRAIEVGISELKWPGRTQIEQIESTTWIFDVAHNEPGASALGLALDEIAPPRPWVAVLGLQADKDAAAMSAHLLPKMDLTILTEAPSVPPDRQWDARTAVEPLSALSKVNAEPDLERAIEIARRAAGDGTVVVCGSHHTVGDALRVLRIAPCDS